MQPAQATYTPQAAAVHRVLLKGIFGLVMFEGNSTHVLQDLFLMSTKAEGAANADSYFALKYHWHIACRHQPALLGSEAEQQVNASGRTWKQVY